MPDDCPFCKIATGEIPANLISESEHTVAFHDVSPQAPTHVLFIPRDHHDTVADLVDAAPEVLVQLHRQALEVAQQMGVAERGYRLVYNTGPDGGQSVQHVHLHLLAGRPMGWPPG